MSALTDQLKETNRLLAALHVTKQRKRSGTSRASQKFSRIDRRKKRARVRALPVLLTRTAVITLLLVSVVIVLGGIEYLNNGEANAVDSGRPQAAGEKSAVQPPRIDDKELLHILSQH